MATLGHFLHEDGVILKAGIGNLLVERLLQKLGGTQTFYFGDGEDVGAFAVVEAQKGLRELRQFKLQDLRMVGEPDIIFFVAGSGAMVIAVVKEVFDVPEAEKILVIGVAGGASRGRAGSRQIEAGRIATADEMAAYRQERDQRQQRSAPAMHGGILSLGGDGRFRHVSSLSRS